MKQTSPVLIRRSVLAALLLLPSLLPAQTARFAYVSNAYDSTLSIYRVLQDGRLRPLGHVPLQRFPSSALAHPSGRFVFVATQTGMSIHVFEVNPRSGALKEIDGSPFDPGVVSPFWLDMDQAGEVLYIAGRNSNAMSAMTIDARTGALRLLKGAPYAGGFLPRAVAAHPSQPWVYMTNINDDSISAYRRDSAEGMKLIGDRAVSVGDAPQFLAMHPDGRRAWLSSWNTRTLIPLRIDPVSGVMTPNGEIPLPDGIHPFGIDITADGRFLYVMGWFGGIAGFRVDADASGLTPLPGSPFATLGTQPVQIFIAPGDDYAYVTNYESHTVTVYAIDSTSGALKPVETVATRIGPRSITFVSGDKKPMALSPSLFALADGRRRLLEYEHIEPGGDLRLRQQLALPAAVDALEVSADGSRLLMADRQRDRLLVYRRNPQGQWQGVPGSPFKARGGPVMVRLDQNDRYVYAINRDLGKLSVYYLLPDTAALDEAPNTPLFSASPYDTGPSPRDLALHPTLRFAYVLSEQDSKPAQLSIFKYYDTSPLVIDVAGTGIPEAPPLERAYTQLELDITGRFFYLADNAGHVDAWHLDTLSGQPRPMARGRVAVAAGELSLLADPVRSRVYALNRDRRLLQVLELDTAVGQLKKGPTLKLPGQPLSFVVDAAGGRAWLSLTNGNVVSYKVSDDNLTKEKIIKTSTPLTDMVTSRVLQ